MSYIPEAIQTLPLTIYKEALDAENTRYTLLLIGAATIHNFHCIGQPLLFLYQFNDLFGQNDFQRIVSHQKSIAQGGDFHFFGFNYYYNCILWEPIIIIVFFGSPPNECNHFALNTNATLQIFSAIG
jgi:hypothetical protein